MLQYSIEGPSAGCCGFGDDEQVTAASAACPAPTISLIKNTATAAKAAGQEAWFETRGGQYMALPRTLCIAGWFKALQRAVNAFADTQTANGQTAAATQIRVDARIGPETLKAVQQISYVIGRGAPTDVNDLTMNYASWIKDISAWSGVPANAAVEPKPNKYEIPQLVDEETAKKAGLPTGKSWFASYWKWLLISAMGVTAGGLGISIYRKKRAAKRYRAPLYIRAGRGI